jgi:hypothetical protein
MVHLVILGVLILPVLLIGAIHGLLLHSPSEIKSIWPTAKRTCPLLNSGELVQTILPIKYYTTAIIFNWQFGISLYEYWNNLLDYIKFQKKSLTKR